METQAPDLILNLPFDEATASKRAYNYAPAKHPATSRNDAVIEGASFIPGRQGNCIHFDGTGCACVNADIVDPAADFTLLAWVRPAALTPGTGTRLGFFLNTDKLNGGHTVWVDRMADEWSHVALRKQGDTVTVFVDTQAREVLTLDAPLEGLGVLQDYYCTEYAIGDLDDVKIYASALTDQQLAASLDNVKMLEYYINGVNFKDLDIRVSSSSGVLDLPKLKTPHAIDWQDYHGEMVDLTDKRLEARTITLNCWIKATGKIDFAQKVNRFYRHFMADGTARLMIEIHPTKPLVYEVYAPDGISHDKKWHDDKMIGTFSLKLKEPDPVKRVLRHQRCSPDTATVTVGFRSDKITTIYWGDGTVTSDVWGDHTGPNSITHTYTKDGTYYPIVAGVVEQITDFSTNAIIVWDMI